MNSKLEHPEFEELYMHLSGEADKDKKIESHLSICSDCQKRLSDIRDMKLIILRAAELKTKNSKANKGPTCPNDLFVANYVETELFSRSPTALLSKDEVEWMERHLEECDFCLNLVLGTYQMLYDIHKDEVLAYARAIGKGEELPPIPVPYKLEIAASDESELDIIRSRIGAEFIERGSIVFGEYSADIYFQDLHSATLVFKKNGKRTSELSGTIIEFFLLGKPMIKYSDKIEKDQVTIDFSQLDLSIQDYEKVAIRISLEKSRVIIFLHNFSALEE